MKNLNHSIELNYLDHVAIHVKDLNKSVTWYQKVLGLKKYQLDAWGESPIFLLAGKTGLALFPAELSDSESDQYSNKVRIDHFAFNVSKENFEKAKQHYAALHIKFSQQDHYYFDSIYTKDPDGHVVDEFYQIG